MGGLNLTESPVANKNSLFLLLTLASGEVISFKPLTFIIAPFKSNNNVDFHVGALFLNSVLKYLRGEAADLHVHSFWS